MVRFTLRQKCAYCNIVCLYEHAKMELQSNCDGKNPLSAKINKIISHNEKADEVKI